MFRAFLILFGEWQDARMEVRIRYMDVDYFVFSDAATLMASRKSPYERSTHRCSVFTTGSFSSDAQFISSSVVGKISVFSIRYGMLINGQSTYLSK